MRNTTRMSEILAEMIDQRGSRRAFAEKIGMPPTTLQSMLTRDLSRASVTNVVDVCRELSITVEELEAMASGEHYEPETIAAHHEGEQWTEEELEEIERFKAFVRLKRKDKEQ
ncbi:helix-turn-helix domain-containing protein [Paenibacillus septentrionalis]|uniref:Helix-turn-helix domain-containing protein n=1 Tax=Paenibacillus septentrionalis TaxID=429342 RepID=A0ABW1V9W2_9BACL